MPQSLLHAASLFVYCLTLQNAAAVAVRVPSLGYRQEACEQLLLEDGACGAQWQLIHLAPWGQGRQQGRRLPARPGLSWSGRPGDEATLLHAGQKAGCWEPGKIK